MTHIRSSRRAALAALAALSITLHPFAAHAAGQKGGTAGGGAKTGAGNAPAAKKPALTRDQIIAKLAGVPLFTFADEKGAPLTASGGNGKPVVGVFVDVADAKTFESSLKKNNKTVAEKVKLVPISLGDVYKISETQKELTFAFVPSNKQLEAAQTLQKDDKKAFSGTPLFVARAGKDKGYLTVTQNNQTVVPLFFVKSDLDALVSRLKQNQPDLAKSVEIEAISLENVLGLMKVGDNPELKRLEIVPPRTALEYVRSLKPEGADGKKPVTAGPKKPS
ncbi:MAG TPA: Tic22 family protein [Armatimonadaceae bacterium]|nr:Tic22 family protein [Armatimonadaceae bacterium]